MGKLKLRGKNELSHLKGNKEKWTTVNIGFLLKCNKGCHVGLVLFFCLLVSE